MSKSTQILAAVSVAVSVFALGVPAMAQDSATPQLEMGQTVQDQAAAAEQITTETFGDWSLQCAATGPDPKPCRMYQVLSNDQGSPIAEVTMFRLVGDNGAVAGANIVVPLETLLTAQLTLSIDGSSAKRYPFAFCNKVGCISRIGFTQDDVDAFKKGASATVMIVPVIAPDQTVQAKLSLTGFTKAYENSNPVNE